MKQPIVIKIGTSLLTDQNGILNSTYLKNIIEDIAWLYQKKNSVVIISSGAIAAGKGKLKITHPLKSLPQKQAVASVGQSLLMKLYDELFSFYQINVAQILLTRDDFQIRSRYLNLRNTLFTLLNLGVIPIINENDAVAVEEIRLGDNDNLSALVASKLNAQELIILSDVDGLYEQDPLKFPAAKIIPIVEKITPQIEKIAGRSSTTIGTGGMKTKISAAKIVTASGIPMSIVNGRRKGVIKDLLSGKQIGTKFLPTNRKISERQRWIAFGSLPKGKIIIDEGASEAIRKNGKSLLPSGIKAIEGNFKPGDTVEVINFAGEKIAQGLTYYSSKDLQKIKGCQTKKIEEILGSLPYVEVIHRNNMVVF